MTRIVGHARMVLLVADTLATATSVNTRTLSHSERAERRTTAEYSVTAADFFEVWTVLKMAFDSADELDRFICEHGSEIHAKLPFGWRLAKRGHHFVVERPDARAIP
jgi:uncharacterized protein (DUF2384 family)